jgi:hypothetical protein
MPPPDLISSQLPAVDLGCSRHSVARHRAGLLYTFLTAAMRIYPRRATLAVASVAGVAAGSHQHRRCVFPGGFSADLHLFLDYRVASTFQPTNVATALSTCALLPHLLPLSFRVPKL